MDLTETLLHGAPSPRQCTFHWHDSKLTDDGSGLAAVRCGDHKAHFYTQGDYAIAGGRSKTWGKGGKQDPPLLFNLTVRTKYGTVRSHSSYQLQAGMQFSAAKRCQCSPDLTEDRRGPATGTGNWLAKIVCLNRLNRRRTKPKPTTSIRRQMSTLAPWR